MERLVSQKSFGMERGRMERVASSSSSSSRTSYSCKVGALGFVCGVCATYISFAVAASAFDALFSFSLHANTTHRIHHIFTDELHAHGTSARMRAENVSNKGRGMQEMEKIRLLQFLWETCYLHSKNKSVSVEDAVDKCNANVPKAPHIENCKRHVKASKEWERHGWKGYGDEDKEEHNNRTTPHSPYPSWVEGGDKDNLPMTSRVQWDLWLHQHPSNCHDPQLRFLFTDWESNPGFGIGAQIAAMAGLLALAINQKRILVTNYLNRADHDGCTGYAHSSWSCYFLPETSAECREHALGLASQAEAWKQGIITSKENYTTKEIWVGKTPRQWGKPWERMQPTTEIDRKLLKHHRTRDRRWWRAQAVRYLMRFKTEYTCELLNMARHQAFGMKAAKMVLKTLPPEWPKVAPSKSESEIERYVWSSHKPWAPRPLLSIHVRLGDKAAEMKMVGFESYMNLAQHIRRCFPDVKNIWLSTEMQEVIEQSKSYVGWNFYYTNVTRQVGNMTMPAYEASLGRETSTNYPLVNFLMAADADFFIGALGSTWCFLIDGMRSTGGKVMAGYLSVNKDRFW